MQINTNVSIHNRFDIVVKNAETGDIEQRGQAENIVLDRIYDRLCNFSTYFVNIVFGSGTGTPIPSRTTLFNRIGSKAAITDELVRAYPTSKWTRKITLGTEEFNGSIIREIGISDTTTNINTHAMITDAEGNPLEIEKTELRIIDIYATVFVNVYNVDFGLRFTSSELRDYLTGGSSPSNSMTIKGFSDDEFQTLTGTRVANISDKSVQCSVKFDVQHWNKEIKYIGWDGIGLWCSLPRLGVWEGINKYNVVLGVGDGVATRFAIPQQIIDNLVVYVNGSVVNDYTQPVGGVVDFSNPIQVGDVVTADYFCKLIPKDEHHITNISAKIKFGVSPPAPIIPQPDFSNIHGGKLIISGDENYGYYGEVSSEELISGDELCESLGLTAGISQNSDAGWLKVVDNGKMLLIAKRTIRHSISWNDINGVGAVFGKLIIIDGVKYIIRLLSSAEWDRFMYPLHVDHPGGTPAWAEYSDADLNVNKSVSGSGTMTWTSTADGSYRVGRGSNSVSGSTADLPSYSSSSCGFRPVLEAVL